MTIKCYEYSHLLMNMRNSTFTSVCYTSVCYISVCYTSVCYTKFSSNLPGFDSDKLT
jgi:hypothetical protein